MPPYQPVTIDFIRHQPLQPGIHYVPIEPEKLHAWKDAYYRRKIAEELPETLEYLTQNGKLDGMCILSITRLPSEKNPHYEEEPTQWGFLKYAPGDMKQHDIRIRMVATASVDAYYQEPSKVEVYEVVTDPYVAWDLEYQGLYIQHMDLYAHRMRNLIIEDFFLEHLSVFVLLRSQVCFARTQVREVRQVFMDYQQQKQ